MDILTIEATKSSPAVFYDPANHSLNLTGECYPENAVKFFDPIFAWLDERLTQSDGKLMTVNITISYFNSSSSKALMNLFEVLEDAYNTGHQIVVNWYYHEDNDTAEECGEEFQEDLETLPFQLIPLS